MPDVMYGYRRPSGKVGFRNRLLVLPSVVCAAHAARSVAEATQAISITHQHGCLHVGDDLEHTTHELMGAAVSPNVGATVVVSLGCETLNGARLAQRIAASGARVELVGIQASGGTARAVEDGRRAVARLSEEIEGQTRSVIGAEELIVGIDDPGDPFAGPLIAALEERGFQVQTPPEDLRGPEAHVALTGAGVQLIVSLPAAAEGPVGFAISPVLAVNRGASLHTALGDDFDIAVEAGEDAAALARRVVDAVVVHANGDPTASERRRATDFVLDRLAVTM